MEENKYFSEEEAELIRSFALAYNDIASMGFGIYTPDTLNRNLKNLNSRNYNAPDYERIMKALANAVECDEELINYQEYVEWADPIFKRTIEYYANILAFDLSYVCINVNHKEIYGTKQYKKDYNTVKRFLSNFDYKGEFKKVVKQMLRSETAFMWLRNNEDKWHPKYTLQLMPQRYCKITGGFEHGMLYDFDMSYFMNSGVDIDGFDPAFKEYAKDVWDLNNWDKYKPTNPFDYRVGSYAQWHQTSPLYMNNGLPSGAWVFKRDASTYNSVPFLSAQLRDAILNIPVSKLQEQKNVIGSQAYLVGDIKMLRADNNEPNQTAFDPKRLGALLAIVKRAVGESIAVGAMPTEATKMYTIKDENTAMVNETYKSSAANSASAGRLLYASDRLNEAEVEAVLQADYNVMEPVYRQFENFLNFYVNQLTKRYKWRFSFTGSTFGFDRDRRMANLMKFSEMGLVPNSSMYASVLGVDPIMFEAMMQESAADNSWLKNVSQLQSIHTSGTSTSVDSNGNEVVHTGRPGRPPLAENVGGDEDASTTET